MCVCVCICSCLLFVLSSVFVAERVSRLLPFAFPLDVNAKLAALSDDEDSAVPRPFGMMARLSDDEDYVGNEHTPAAYNAPRGL